jgi:hypothetical protein
MHPVARVPVRSHIKPPSLLGIAVVSYFEEAGAFREWLLRAAAGSPSQLQIMYGVAGERRLPEEEIPWLPGYEQSRPVRLGNLAYQQRQLDVYGELRMPCTGAGAACHQPHTPGSSSGRWSSSWRPSGRRRTKASGRSAVRAATSPTRRSWPGWRSTGQSRAWRASASPVRSIAGGSCGRGSTPRYAKRVSARHGEPSPSSMEARG